VLDPACGSGGFLVVVLAHQRRRLLSQVGANPDAPVPSELRRIDRSLRSYARSCLFGVDVDPDLRKAARMNMVMNNDGHGNIFTFNSLEYAVEGRESSEMALFNKAKGDHGRFDYVFTNPPFGSKIPITDSSVLRAFDLGHMWAKVGDTWQRGNLQKKVAPEILFIEGCYNYLKPATGIMGIVMPNGILGNPGLQMEAVRAWMLTHLELLASIDLAAEAFLPQVSVQASCVLLRRRHPDELLLSSGSGPKQGPVFMAISESVGHGRRGEIKYVRNPDGSEQIQVKEFLERWETKGKVLQRLRRKEVRVIADDLPWIADQYLKYRGGLKFEES
jgi:type I restriction enzyme M protein